MYRYCTGSQERRTGLPEVEPEIEDWHAADEPVANDEAYHPRFRSPALRSYDPGQFSDGSWESHFYMAPNVRFTRTPDKVAAKIEEAAAEGTQQAETVEQPVQVAQPNPTATVTPTQKNAGRLSTIIVSEPMPPLRQPMNHNGPGG